MEQITPFNSASQAIDILDNGGEFYHIFTKADDDSISQSEVSKIAGAGLEKQKGILYLQLALSNLNEREVQEVQARFDDKLLENYNKYKAESIEVFEGLEGFKSGASIMLHGTPKHLQSEGYITGFMQIAIIDAFTLIPITEKYSVYEMYDAAGTKILVAHDKEAGHLPNEEIKIAGVVKEFQLSEENASEFERFVEVAYFSEVK